MTARIVTVVVAVACVVALGPCAEAARRAGTIVSVDPGARTLVVEEMGVAGKLQRVVMRVAADARVVRSERSAAREAVDPSSPFAVTPIRLDGVIPGDFVVIESSSGEQAEIATSVDVTYRARSAR
jgi:hypothetical protein